MSEVDDLRAHLAAAQAEHRKAFEESARLRIENAALAERIGELAELRADALSQRNALAGENVRLREALRKLEIKLDWNQDDLDQDQFKEMEALIDEALQSRQDNSGGSDVSASPREGESYLTCVLHGVREDTCKTCGLPSPREGGQHETEPTE